MNLKRGTTYFETFTFGASGTSSNKITLRAYGTGACPVIFPATKLDAGGWTHKENGVYQYSKSIAPAFLTMKINDKIKMLFNI